MDGDVLAWALALSGAGDDLDVFDSADGEIMPGKWESEGDHGVHTLARVAEFPDADWLPQISSTQSSITPCNDDLYVRPAVPLLLEIVSTSATLTGDASGNPERTTYWLCLPYGVRKRAVNIYHQLCLEGFNQATIGRFFDATRNSINAMHGYNIYREICSQGIEAKSSFLHNLGSMTRREALKAVGIVMTTNTEVLKEAVNAALILLQEPPNVPCNQQ